MHYTIHTKKMKVYAQNLTIRIKMQFLIIKNAKSLTIIACNSIIY